MVLLACLCQNYAVDAHKNIVCCWRWCVHVGGFPHITAIIRGLYLYPT